MSLQIPQFNQCISWSHETWLNWATGREWLLKVFAGVIDIKTKHLKFDFLRKNMWKNILQIFFYKQSCSSSSKLGGSGTYLTVHASLDVLKWPRVQVLTKEAEATFQRHGTDWNGSSQGIVAFIIFSWHSGADKAADLLKVHLHMNIVNLCIL